MADDLTETADLTAGSGGPIQQGPPANVEELVRWFRQQGFLAGDSRTELMMGAAIRRLMIDADQVRNVLTHKLQHGSTGTALQVIIDAIRTASATVGAACDPMRRANLEASAHVLEACLEQLPVWDR